MPPTLRTPAAAALPTALILLTAACGGGSGHSKAQAGATAATAAAELDQALTDLGKHSSVHVTDSSLNSKSAKLTADLRLESDGSVGSLTLPLEGEQVRAQVMQVSDVAYLRGARYFALAVKSQVGAAAAARAEKVIGDHWVKVPAALLGDKIPLTLPSLVDFIRPSDDSDVPYFTGPGTVSGHPVESVSAGPDMYWITTGATPEILKAVESQDDDSQDTMLFTDFDVPLTLTPPTDVFNMSGATGAGA